MLLLVICEKQNESHCRGAWWIKCRIRAVSGNAPPPVVLRAGQFLLSESILWVALLRFVALRIA